MTTNAVHLAAMKYSQQDEERMAREKRMARLYGRPTTYRLPEELREELRALADREQVPVNALVAEALRRFLDDVAAGHAVGGISGAGA